ncbi:hypothetical protein AC1031_000001 [Aphanomyces cochlioides]|nr:hypothetical protein AC1031_000001 [Aphanomyces cochlioides]
MKAASSTVKAVVQENRKKDMAFAATYGKKSKSSMTAFHLESTVILPTGLHGLPRRWDDFSATHLTMEGGFTWICQLADVAWVKPVKAPMRHRWVEYLRIEITKHKAGQFKLTPPDRFDLDEWVNAAWYSVKSSTIQKGFVKCNIIENAVPLQPFEIDANDAVADDAHQVLEALTECSAMEMLELVDDFLLEEN